MTSEFGRKVNRRISRFIWEKERVLLALLAVVIVISGAVWYRQFGSDSGGPNSGGAYVEGIVGTQKDAQMIASRLTKTGLFGVNSDGSLKNQLVSDWKVNPEKTQYTFNLIDGIDKDEVVKDLKASGDTLSNAIIRINDTQQLEIKVSQADPNLPILLTQPLINYGPYKLSKMTDQLAVFNRSTDNHASKAYINRIVVQNYDNANQLADAIKGKKLDGSENVDVSLPDGYSRDTLYFPRYYAILFNTNKSPFRDAGLRQALINETATSGDFVLTVADAEPYKGLAQSYIAKWQSLGVKVTIDLKSIDEIQNKIGPSRDFQAMLTGIDYGPELDPYYLWHSSQIRPPGNNLTGIKNQTIDDLLAKIQASLNLNERHELIKTLHAELTKDSVALIIKQETADFILSNDVSSRDAWLPLSVRDRFQAIGDWYVK